jgi:hypothetical protein
MDWPRVRRIGVWLLENVVSEILARRRNARGESIPVDDTIRDRIRTDLENSRRPNPRTVSGNRTD